APRVRGRRRVARRRTALPRPAWPSAAWRPATAPGTAGWVGGASLQHSFHGLAGHRVRRLEGRHLHLGEGTVGHRGRTVGRELLRGGAGLEAFAGLEPRPA